MAQGTGMGRGLYRLMRNPHKDHESWTQDDIWHLIIVMGVCVACPIVAPFLLWYSMRFIGDGQRHKITYKPIRTITKEEMWPAQYK